MKVLFKCLTRTNFYAHKYTRTVLVGKSQWQEYRERTKHVRGRTDVDFFYYYQRYWVITSYVSVNSWISILLRERHKDFTAEKFFAIEVTYGNHSKLSYLRLNILRRLLKMKIYPQNQRYSRKNKVNKEIHIVVK